MTDTFTSSALAHWRHHPQAFIERVLRDPETGKPFKLLPAERAFFKHAFQRDDEGRLLYPEQVYACPKKSGKTTFGAIHSLTTTLLFGGSYPEATICANDQEQAQSRVYEMLRRIIACSPALKAEAKVTQDKITFPALNATFAAIASDYAGAAGGNQCISVFDELWAFRSERSHRLWDESCHRRRARSRAVSSSLMPVSRTKANCSTNFTSAACNSRKSDKTSMPVTACLMFWSHEPIAPWQDQRWLTEMRRSLRPAQFLRMIENRFVTTESTFIDMSWWDACVDPQARPIVQDRQLSVWVGIDASVKRDSTAIVACTWDRTAKQVRLVNHRIFQPSPDQPLDFELCIEHTLLALKQRFNVRQAIFDPYQMQASAQRLKREGMRIEEFPQSVPNLTEASQNLYELIKGRNLVAYADAALRLAISRAVAVEGTRGWRIAKEKQCAQDRRGDRARHGRARRRQGSGQLRQQRRVARLRPRQATTGGPEDREAARAQAQGDHPRYRRGAILNRRPIWKTISTNITNGTPTACSPRRKSARRTTVNTSPSRPSRIRRRTALARPFRTAPLITPARTGLATGSPTLMMRGALRRRKRMTNARK